MLGSKQKSLIVSWIYPWPESIGGSIRTLNFVRFLRNYGEVDILYSQSPSDRPADNPLFSCNHYLEKKPYPEDLISRLILSVKGVPYPIREYGSDALRRLLALVEANDYRCILARYCHSTSGLFSMRRKFKSRTIVDIDDILSGSAYASLFDNRSGAHRKIFRALNRKLLARYEKKCLSFGATLFSSELDRAKFDRSGRKSTFVIPNIYENKSFEGHAIGDGYGRPNTLLFVGALHYPPNIEGLRWFIQTIFVKFKNEFNDAKLIVVGHAPAAEVKMLCDRTESVELYADAADIQEYYARSRAVVVPLLSGGGTRIKILEAALAKRPILSTPMGAEGLEMQDGRDLLLFETPEGFFAKYRALSDRCRYDSMVADAQRIVQERYSRRNFEDAMQRVMGILEGA